MSAERRRQSRLQIYEAFLLKCVQQSTVTWELGVVGTSSTKKLRFMVVNINRIETWGLINTLALLVLCCEVFALNFCLLAWLCKSNVDCCLLHCYIILLEVR